MERKIVIWGTGREADKFMKWLSYVNDLAEKTIGKKACDVAYFLDSNANKARQFFYGKKVKLPQFRWHKDRYCIVVAVAKNEEILSALDQHGYSRKNEYLTLSDFYHWLLVELCFPWLLIQALGVKENDFVTSIQRKYLPYDILVKFERFLEELQCICSRRGNIDCFDILKKILVPTIFLSDCDWPDKQAMGEKILNLVGSVSFISCLEIIYGKNTAAAAEWMPEIRKNGLGRRLPRTLGIYYIRYYNGGVERVISKLLPIFKNHGYSVVLFTDEIREDLEYPIPDGITRVLLGYEGGRKGRCKRLVEALQVYDVDVFCSHAYCGDILYDIFCVQQAGVPVVLELHNIFSFIIDIMGINAISLVRRADVVVTLSRVDDMFWRLLGGNSRYIPNPVELPEKIDTNIRKNNILWLARIDQIQKQVFDLPIILEYVTQSIPNAKLQIVGGADDLHIEQHLKHMFEERGLLDNVEFCGYHKDVEQYYQQATVMLMTSAFEGFPMTVVESKRYGVPLVMYELPYLELLHDGKGYIAVHQSDKRRAADALVKVLSDSELRHKLSLDAKASIMRFSDIDIMSEWEQVWNIAFNSKNIILSDYEKIFSEVERLLLGNNQIFLKSIV